MGLPGASGGIIGCSLFSILFCFVFFSGHNCRIPYHLQQHKLIFFWISHRNQDLLIFFFYRLFSKTPARCPQGPLRSITMRVREGKYFMSSDHIVVHILHLTYLLYLRETQLDSASNIHFGQFVTGAIPVFVNDFSNQQ